MNKDAVPYIAFTCILGVIEALLLSKAGDPATSSDYIVTWLVYTVACGVILNYKIDLSFTTLLALSLPSPTVVGLVYAYLLYLHGGIQLSGRAFMLKDLPQLWPLLCLAWVFSILAIWIFGFARPIVLSVVGTAMSKDKANKLESALNWAARVGASAFLIVKAFR